MNSRMLGLCIAALVSLAAAGSRPATQSDPYAKLIGTWVMDTTNGTDDKGLPKSETLVFSHVGAGLRISATTDEGKGASTSAFDCLPAPGAGKTDLGDGKSMRCTIQTTPDSVAYSLNMIDNGKITPTEKGRIVVQPNGLLRDQYAALSGWTPTLHRHIYHKVS